MRDTELYSRQQPLDIQIPSSAVVFGVGGIGFWVAFFLTMQGVEALTVWDDDVLEESNRARLPFTAEDVGQLKTDLTRKFLLRLRPMLDFTAYGKATAELLSFIESRPIVAFDCTDNSQAQKDIYTWCKRQGVSYIKAGYDGFSGTVTDQITGWDMTPTQAYTVTPSWLAPAVIIAGLAVVKDAANLGENLYGDIRKIKLEE